MKNEIIKIAKDLEQGTVTPEQAQTLLLGLFGVSGCYYCHKLKPPWWVRWFFVWECPKCGMEHNNR